MKNKNAWKKIREVQFRKTKTPFELMYNEMVERYEKLKKEHKKYCATASAEIGRLQRRIDKLEKKLR